jgi:hypothetical protein
MFSLDRAAGERATSHAPAFSRHPPPNRVFVISRTQVSHHLPRAPGSVKTGAGDF